MRWGEGGLWGRLSSKLLINLLRCGSLCESKAFHRDKSEADELWKKNQFNLAEAPYDGCLEFMQHVSP